MKKVFLTAILSISLLQSAHARFDWISNTVSTVAGLPTQLLTSGHMTGNAGKYALGLGTLAAATAYFINIPKIKNKKNLIDNINDAGYTRGAKIIHKTPYVFGSLFLVAATTYLINRK